MTAVNLESWALRGPRDVPAWNSNPFEKTPLSAILLRGIHLLCKLLPPAHNVYVTEIALVFTASCSCAISETIWRTPCNGAGSGHIFQCCPTLSHYFKL